MRTHTDPLVSMTTKGAHSFGQAAAQPTNTKPKQPPTEPAGQKFLEAFGEKGGVWFAEGKTFEQAQKLYVADLKATNEAQQKQIKELTAQVNGEAARYSAALGDNLGKVAAGITFNS